MFREHFSLLGIVIDFFSFFSYAQMGHWKQGFQNRTEPGGRTVKIGNRDENRFFKPKESDFLLIL